MAIQANEASSKAGQAARIPSSRRMPRAVRLGVMAVLAVIVAGALYLLAVRGDALLADLSAIAALICG